MGIKLSLRLLALIPVLVFASGETPEVTIKQGTLRGKVQQTSQGRSFSAFTAIPYAKPPVGELRFKPSVPAGPWQGILDARKPPAVCPQADLFLGNATVIGDEDCLYLNIYTPQLPNSKDSLLPVLINIHGGGWIAGSANVYGPDLLLDKDIVLVTINYRLGALGFFTTGDTNAIGNDGLKDQVLAIKWVKENVAQFGGDPESITVAGQSAGGASAHYHMLSPLSRDLIKGVIAQSGTALSQWALMPHFLSTRRSKVLAHGLGCPNYFGNEMMECLRKVDAYDIVKQSSMFVEWDVEPIIPFKPVIEPPVPWAFLPQDPSSIIMSGKAANVPLMTGLTTHEAAARAAAICSNPELVGELNKDFDKLAPLTLHYGESASKRAKDTAHADIRKFYFQDQDIDASKETQIGEMYSDAMILAGEDSTVELHAKFSKQPVYYYLFGYRGSASYCTLSGKVSGEKDVCHCDELLYLFNIDEHFPDYKPTESDREVSQVMTALWANFVKYGNPTPEVDTTIPVKWEPVRRGKQNYYYIKGGSDVELAEGLYFERAKFWRNLPLNAIRKKIRDEL